MVSEKQPRQVTEAYLGSLVLAVYMAARPCNRSGKSWVTRYMVLCVCLPGDGGRWSGALVHVQAAQRVDRGPSPPCSGAHIPEPPQ